eukprot:2780823-Alexandrium_andersonii.AAC.1
MAVSVPRSRRTLEFGATATVAITSGPPLKSRSASRISGFLCQEGRKYSRMVSGTGTFPPLAE